MAGVGRDPSTGGVADAYPFADAFVLDDDDPTDLPDRHVERTDTRIDDADDAERVVARVCDRALAAVEGAEAEDGREVAE